MYTQFAARKEKHVEFGEFVMKKVKIHNILKKVSHLRIFCGIMNMFRKNELGKEGLTMENSASGMIRRIYGTSAVPVAAADAAFRVLWKNAAAEASGFFDGNKLLFTGCGEFSEGMKSVLIDGRPHIFNIIKCEADEYFCIIEYVGRDTRHDISDMKDYFSFLCARLRESASQISMAADDIDMCVKNNDTNVASSLNRINRNVMLLLKEVLVPENIFYASASECRDEPINLAHAVAVSAGDAETALGRQSEIWQNETDDVCASVNSSVFEAIIAQMTAQVCGGEFYPDRVEFNVGRYDNDSGRGYVSVRSVCLSGKRNRLFTLEHMKQNEFFTDNVLKGVLNEKYGMSFEMIKHTDGSECVMSMNVIPDTMVIVKTDRGISFRQERFTSMSAALSEKHCAERYKNISMV